MCAQKSKSKSKNKIFVIEKNRKNHVVIFYIIIDMCLIVFDKNLKFRAKTRREIDLFQVHQIRFCKIRKINST